MPLRTPEFWAENSLSAHLLRPVGWLYNLGRGLAAARQAPQPAAVPVICVGNATLGGSGKTPTVIALARLLRLDGFNPAILSRGYGGREKGPIQVSPENHTAGDVGDEPLLLAAVCPTWVSADRVAGAQNICTAGHDVIIMDDGLQNPSLIKDFSFLVVDNRYGVGNGRLFPAGPLREPIEEALARSHAVVRVTNAGEQQRNGERRGWQPPGGFTGPIFDARILPDETAMDLRGQKVVAFAGIGRPEKFFATLRALGALPTVQESFADHHRYTADEVMRLVETAAELGAVAVTTAKDYVRLPREALPMVAPVRVTLDFDDPDTILTMMRAAINRRREPETAA